MSNELRRRLVIWGAILIPLLYALMVNVGSLHSPPAWDSSITVSPAALTIAESDFDVWGVAQLPPSPEGGPSTHATSLYTIGLAFLIAWLGPESAFFVAHLASIALVAALSGATYLLARERASVVLSALTAVTVGVIPLVVQQAADVYLDLPLAVITTLACWAASRRWFWWTGLAVFLGVALKTSGLFLIPLLLFARPKDKALPRHLTHTAIAALFAFLPLAMTVATTHRFSTSMTPSSSLILISSSAVMLLLTFDVLAVLAVFVGVAYGRARNRVLDRPTLAGLIVVGSFIAIHLATVMLSGTIAILPRYYISLLPAMLATIPPSDVTVEGRPSAHVAATGFVVLLAVFSIVNVRGDLYLEPNHGFPVVAERSTRAQDLLELQVLGTQQLVSRGIPIVAERQVHFRLRYPGMGYVEETPRDVYAVLIDPERPLPEEFVMLIEWRNLNPLVPIEEQALAEGYDLTYEELAVGPFRSQLITASR